MAKGPPIRSRHDTDELFDYDLGYYDMNAPIAYKGPAKAALQTKQSRRTAGRRKSSVSAPRPEIRSSPSLLEGTTDPADPLPPSEFIGHHRRMEREEKRMQNLDRQKLQVDAERVSAQRELLLAASWRREISGIVRLEEPISAADVLAKRKLALAEMDLFLSRYDKMKRRERGLPENYVKPIKPAVKRRQSKAGASKSPSPAPDPVVLCIPKTAFGFPIAYISSRPHEFDIPHSWKHRTTESEEPTPRIEKINRNGI